MGLNKRKGFTLVELLVVIGIIAILAGVALGPITRAMKSAKQNAGLQTSRTLALAEFQYANDNGQNYPDTGSSQANSATHADAVGNCLLAGGYVSDPGLFVISGGSETKYTGSLTTPNILTSNISWDFAGNTSGQGVNANAPDTLPVVWSTIGSTSFSPLLSATGPSSATLGASLPFAQQGIAVCYKSNSAQFITASGSTSSVQITTAAYPGWTVTVLSGGG
jgi:prepilin-type N-terminal cleavage/methylation domain-containing protein